MNNNKRERISRESKLIYLYFRLEETEDVQGRSKLNDEIITSQLEYKQEYGGYFELEDHFELGNRR